MSTAARLGRFYGYFAAAYGTLWLVILFAALVSQSNISTGEFGLFGFPVIALLYAVLRDRVAPSRSDSTAELAARLAHLESRSPVAPGLRDDPTPRSQRFP